MYHVSVRVDQRAVHLRLAAGGAGVGGETLPQPGPEPRHAGPHPGARRRRHGPDRGSTSSVK